MLPIRTLVVFALVVDCAEGFATSAVPARHLSISKWGNHRISATHNVRALLAHAHGEADARRRAASTGHARIIGVASDRTPIYDCFEDEIQEALPQVPHLSFNSVLACCALHGPVGLSPSFRWLVYFRFGTFCRLA